LNSASELRFSLSGDAEMSLLGTFTAPACLRLIMRAASMGVSVNDTISETAIANEDVKAKRRH